MKYLKFTHILAALALCLGIILLKFPPLKVKHDDFFFEVTATSSKLGHFQLFLDDGYGFREKHVITFPIKEVNKEVDYRFSLPEGDYKSLRFDPNQTQGLVSIKNTRIVDSKGSVVRSIALPEFTAEKQIESLNLINDTLVIKTAVDCHDPDIILIFNDPLNLSIPLYRTIKRSLLSCEELFLRVSFLFIPLLIIGFLLEAVGPIQSAYSNALDWIWKKRSVKLRAGISVFSIALVFTLLALRQHMFVNRYAVNMMFWDQWDFYQPLFKHQSLWEGFIRQHGPHRQGLGFLLTELLAYLSHWNSRMDAFGVSFCLTTAVLLAFKVARLCGANNALSFLTIPFLFLNYHQWEVFVGPTNISHGAMPILLLMFYCIAWFIKKPQLRWLALGFITFLLIFTGFGLFVGVITPLLALIELIQAQLIKDKVRVGATLIGLGLTGIAWILFCHNYLLIALEPTGPATLSEMISFVGLMLANFFGLIQQGVYSQSVGLMIFISLGLITIIHLRKCIISGISKHPRSVVLFSLGAYAIIYCVVTAHGRAGSYESGAPIASRYVTLMITAGFVVLLHLATLKGALRYSLIYLILVLLGTTYLQPVEEGAIKYYSEGKLAWKHAYLKTHDEIQAEINSDFPIYPGRLPERLKYMQNSKLNLFLPEN